MVKCLILLTVAHIFFSQSSFPLLNKTISAFSLAKADISFSMRNSLSFMALPSMLNKNDDKRVSFQYLQWSEVNENKSFMYSSSLFGLGFGVYGILSTVSDIEERLNPSTEPISVFENSESLLAFSLSKNIIEKLFMGLSYKQLFFNIHNYESKGYAIDFSSHYLLNRFTVYSSIRNLGKMSKLKNDRIDISPSFALGVHYDIDDQLAVSTEFQKIEGFEETVHIAGNYNLTDDLALMAGYILNDKSRDFSFGLSVDYHFLTIVYGYANHKFINYYQSFQLALSF